MKHNTSTIDKNTIKTETVIPFSSKKDWGISFRLHLPGFHQESVSQINSSYYVTLSGTHQGACCPVCGQFSNHVKGYYLRSLQGLEIAGHPLTLIVNVRKFRCRNTACQRKVFSPPLSRWLLRTREIPGKWRNASGAYPWRPLPVSPVICCMNKTSSAANLLAWDVPMSVYWLRTA